MLILSQRGFISKAFAPPNLSLLSNVGFLILAAIIGRSEGSAMYAVQCPHCGSVVDIPDDAVGSTARIVGMSLAANDCDSGFDYDDEEI